MECYKIDVTVCLEQLAEQIPVQSLTWLQLVQMTVLSGHNQLDHHSETMEAAAELAQALLM